MSGTRIFQWHWVLFIVLALAFAIFGAVLTGGRALAAFSEISGSEQAGEIHVSVDNDYPLWRTMQAGESMDWILRSELEGAPVSEFSLEIHSDGRLVTAAGMTVALTSCDEEFEVTGGDFYCAQETVVLSPTPLSEVSMATSGTRFALADLHFQNARFIHARFTLPPNHAEILEGDHVDIGLGLMVAGRNPAGTPANFMKSPDEPQIAPDLPRSGPNLPRTGADLAGPLMLSVGILLLGIALRRKSNWVGDRDATE